MRGRVWRILKRLREITAGRGVTSTSQGDRTGRYNSLFAEGLDVGEILQSTCGPLVPHELLTPDERQVAGTATAGLTARPGLVPRDAAERAHHVDLNGFDSHLQDAVGAGEIFRPEITGGDALPGRLSRFWD